ncbi:MAG: uracil-xanthine permease [Rhizobiales bacterium]|nr:uracil-xanthine permease [Hyphomicrobiales bacterium]
MNNDISNTDYNFSPSQALVGGQMLFVAFGALVLVPLLTGLDPSVALFTAGVGTLIFQLVTRGKVPIFLASSFAFIAPIQASVAEWGISSTMSGLAAAGLFYVALSLAIRAFGTQWLHRVFPPIVVGPVIMVIGLALAKVAVDMATGAADGQKVPTGISLTVATVTLIATAVIAVMGKGMMRIVPILGGICIGYVFALILGAVTGVTLVNFSNVASASLVALPAFVMPTFHMGAILFMLPVAIAPAIEHFGDVMAIGGVTKKNYLEDPGIHRTMLGDGLATTAAGLLGGPPNTTYSEVTGAVTLTRAFNPAIMTWAAIFAIVLSFSGTLNALLGSIPLAVMGGVMVLMFGLIAVVGMTTVMKVGEALTEPRNMIIASIILVVGIGGLSVPFGGGFKMAGIGLAGIVGVLLNLLLPASSSASSE